MRFAEAMGQLTDEQWLHFYEVLAHNLTVAVRGIWSDSNLEDSEKVDRMKWLNEVLHRVTAKVYVLRLRTHEWTESEFENLLLEYAQSRPNVATDLGWAVWHSYKTVAGKDMP